MGVVGALGDKGPIGSRDFRIFSAPFFAKSHKWSKNSEKAFFGAGGPVKLILKMQKASRKREEFNESSDYRRGGGQGTSRADRTFGALGTNECADARIR